MKHAIATLLLVLAIAVGTCHAATTQPVPSGSISGTVRLAGKPEAGVVVWLDVPASVGGHANYTSVTTGKDGAYSFHYLPPGTFGVHEVLPAGQAVSYPPGGLLVPTLTAGMQVTAADFANTPVATPVAVLPPVVVQPPPVVPTPVVLPPPLPTTGPAQSGIVCGVGPTAGPTANYTGQAPFVGVFSAAQLTTTRNHHRRWHLASGAAPIADPRALVDPVRYAAAVDTDNAWIGQTTAALYDRPGTYAASLDVTNPDGSTVTYTQTVTVAPSTLPHYYFGPAGSDANAGTDPAHPLLSANKLAQLVAKGNAWCTALPGTVYRTPITVPFPAQIGGTINVGSNVVVDAADETQPPPTILLGANGGFYAGPGVHNVLIRGLRFDSVGVKQGNVIVAPSGAGGARAEAIINNGGSGIALVRCRFGCLQRLGEHDAGDGLIFLGCVQERADNVQGQGIGAFGPGRVLVLGCQCPGCFGEAVFRMSGVGVGANCAVEGNLLGQMLPQQAAAADKSPLDVRTCPGGFVSANNAIVNGTASLTDGHSASSVTDVLMEGDSYFTTDGISPASQFLVINGKVSGVTLRGLTFPVMPKTLAAVSITPGPGLGDIVFDGCTTPAAMALHNLPAGQTVARVTTVTGK